MNTVLNTSCIQRPLICDFVEMAYMKLFLNKGNIKTDQLIERIYSEHDWNILREWDILKIIYLSRNKNTIAKLFHGTISPGFQKRITALCDYHGMEIPSDYYVSYCNNKETKYKQIDIKDILFKKRGENNFLINKLFKTLLIERYSRLNVGDLFQELYPDECFNITTSPNRIHQLCYRLSKLLKRGEGPTLENSHQFYFFNLNKKASIKIKLSNNDLFRFRDNVSYRVETYLYQIKKNFGKNKFSPKEVATFLNISNRTVNRLLKECLDAKLLVHEGRTKSKLYWIIF